MGDRILNAATVVIAACAVIVVGLLVRREFFVDSPSADPARGPVVVEDWQRLLNGDRQEGSSSPRMTVVEFVDYQCPFCLQAERRIDQLREEYPDDLAVSYRHLPLAIHPHAFDAAVASECAGEQGLFLTFHDVLFENQMAIGIDPWIDFAKRAGVPDHDRFLACLDEDAPRDRVEADMALAQSIGVTGTPSFVVEGLLLEGLPGVDSMEVALGRIDR